MKEARRGVRKKGRGMQGWDAVKAPAVVEHGLELCTFADCGLCDWERKRLRFKLQEAEEGRFYGCDRWEPEPGMKANPTWEEKPFVNGNADQGPCHLFHRAPTMQTQLTKYQSHSSPWQGLVQSYCF